jgi:hypothetical protein
VDEGTAVESWNPNANGGVGEVIAEWKAQVAADADSEQRGVPATLLHTLIPTLPADMPLQVGDAVTVREEDDGSWLIVNVLGTPYSLDPGYIRTGTIQADVSITVGTPGAQRVVIKGEPAIEAYNAANEQTVNIDGEVNYMLGTLATAASGARVTIGPGLLGGDPTNEVRLDSENPNETGPALLSAVAVGPLSLLMLSGAPTTGLGSSAIQIAADSVNIAGPTTFGDPVDATMGAGSVGTGTFRDSVDARVTAVGDADYQPLDATLTGIAGTTVGAADLMLYSTGADTFATTGLSALGRNIIDETTVGDVRALLLARALRRTINSQTTDYTLLASDEEKIIQVNSGSARVITVPNDTTATTNNGYEVEIVRIGAGTVTIAPDTSGATVTINSRSGLLAINGQYGSVRLRKRAANTWILTGDLA